MDETPEGGRQVEPDYAAQFFMDPDWAGQVSVSDYPGRAGYYVLSLILTSDSRPDRLTSLADLGKSASYGSPTEAHPWLSLGRVLARGAGPGGVAVHDRPGTRGPRPVVSGADTPATRGARPGRAAREGDGAARDPRRG